ncbi:GMC family oxidoreductase [Pseudooceanicola sp. MF1-13]|uniref:GMC family oxidoreductase n=1 Tax=Pseudooceanicola sp. MF1-13 TaxID=3379095 RepID=UPI0038916728
MSEEFDYVIVGAGSAGAVLAHRMSEDPAIRVCLLEAGGRDSSPLISTPIGVAFLAKNPRHTWGFTSAPQTALDGRELAIPRGRVLGGSSAINGMIYIRGHRADYDDWAHAGCVGWDYDSVLPYFRKAEGNTRPGIDTAVHGTDGPLSVSDLGDPNSTDYDFLEAAQQMQLRTCADFNVAEPEGVGIYQVSQKDGRRHSTSAAYLAGIRSRPNLKIITGAEASQILIDNQRAVGIAYTLDGQQAQVRARAEVILATGAIGSPDLLLRSGIGPGAQIKGFGGDVVHDLPGVGANLQDHTDVMIICRTKSTAPWGVSARALPKLAIHGLNWMTRRRGMLSSNMVEAGGFIRSQPSEPRPDLQFHFIPGLKSHRGRLVEYGHGVSLHTCILRPDSRGSVTRDAPAGAPIVDLGLLTADTDMDRLLRGVKIARDILAQPPLARHGLDEVLPGEAVQDDDGLRSYLRAQARTVYHPVGTCAMGTGHDAVVDTRLRVHGIAGLRIADASIMPTIVSGNTNAPAIMIGEKAADMIKEDAKHGAAALETRAAIA